MCIPYVPVVDEEIVLRVIVFPVVWVARLMPLMLLLSILLERILLLDVLSRDIPVEEVVMIVLVILADGDMILMPMPVPFPCMVRPLRWTPFASSFIHSPCSGFLMIVLFLSCPLRVIDLVTQMFSR